MTRLEMILTMRNLYGDKSAEAKQFEKLILNPDVKHRHLETIVKIHKENFEKGLDKQALL